MKGAIGPASAPSRGPPPGFQPIPPGPSARLASPGWCTWGPQQMYRFAALRGKIPSLLASANPHRQGRAEPRRYRPSLRAPRWWRWGGRTAGEPLTGRRAGALVGEALDPPCPPDAAVSASIRAETPPAGSTLAPSPATQFGRLGEGKPGVLAPWQGLALTHFTGSTPCPELKHLRQRPAAHQPVPLILELSTITGGLSACHGDLRQADIAPLMQRAGLPLKQLC